MSKTSQEDKKYIILGGAVCAIIAVVALFISSQNKPPEEQTQTEEPTMTIIEAQRKCTLMEEADLVNLMGERFGEATTKKAEDHCFRGWDRSKNIENTEEKFIEIIKADWEERKNEVLEGYTLEQYYEEMTKL